VTATVTMSSTANPCGKATRSRLSPGLLKPVANAGSSDIAGAASASRNATKALTAVPAYLVAAGGELCGAICVMCLSFLGLA